MTFAATVLTLYPEMFPGPLGHSLAGRALAEGLWSCEAGGIRAAAIDRRRTVDGTPSHIMSRHLAADGMSYVSTVIGADGVPTIIRVFDRLS